MQVDAETTPLRDPEHYQLRLQPARHRGSVAARQCSRFLAAGLNGDALCWMIQPYRSSQDAYQTRAKAVGRSRLQLTKLCPRQFLTTALYERFSSRGEAGFYQTNCCLP